MDLINNFICKMTDGRVFELKNAGDYVYIGFWATWCPSCLDELVYMQKIYDEYNCKVDFIFVSCDEEVTEIKKFVRTGKYSIPIGYDLDGKICKLYKIRSIPCSFFIHKSGENILKLKNIVGARRYNELKLMFEEFYTNQDE